MMPNVYAARSARREHCRLIISPRGTLSPWALKHHRIRKKLLWATLQGPAVSAAQCLHATGEGECNDIRRFGLRQPICIIPNGVDIPRQYSGLKSARPILLFLGRIHPIKGIDILLYAWNAVQHRFPDWELHIAGPHEGDYSAAMQALAVDLRLERIVFRGPLYGDAKIEAYMAASVVVLPTHSENFGMTVAEALAAGTPVVVSKGAPWAKLPEQGAGWWVEIGVDPLVSCLEQALATAPKRLKEMGQAGREWMKRDFAWEQIGSRFLDTYRWLHEGGVVPPWVKFD
jgi:glycosyltransferase involved in cell wall biosynthesis